MNFKRAAALCLTAVLTGSLLAGCAKDNGAAGTSPVERFSFEGWESGSVDFPKGMGIENMKKVAENGGMELYINELSLEFALRSQESGRIWYSSPVCDPAYTGAADDATRALIQLRTTQDGSEKSYDSFSNSVKSGQFAVETTGDGVHIQMSVGQLKEITALDLPQAVEKERFETEILAKLDEDGQAELNKRYTLYSINDTSISERKMNAALEKFPILKERDLYLLNDGVPNFAAQTVKDYLDSIGYDTEQIQKDNDDNGANLDVEEIIRYDFEMDIALEDGQLAVTLDCSRLRETDAQVTDVLLLPMFAASAHEEDEGFLLLPDGSGSIQNINGENAAYSSYSIRIYGEEKSIRKEQQFGATEASVLPVFGEKCNDAGFVAMIEDGDALASVTTNLKSGQPFSSVYASFKVAEAASIDAGFADAQASTNVPMVQPVMYTGKLTVRYALLEGEDASLGGMSRAVRERYQETGLLPEDKIDTAEIPLNLELIGSVDKESALLGIFPVRRQMAATTFVQAAEIVSALHDKGIGPINVQYIGWCNGGVYTQHLQKLKVEKVLGGAGGLTTLAQQLAAQGDALYPRVELMEVANTKGFNTQKLAARALGNNLTALYQYDTATGWHYDYRVGTLVAPAALGDYTAAFLRNYNKLDVGAVSVTDMGRELYADMNKAAGVNRQDALGMVGEALAQLNGQKLMVAGGNLYTWAGAEYITSLPTDSSRYSREQYAVPFVQMVLHGYKAYGTSPINNAADYKEAMLRAVAFGAHANFRFIYAPSEFLNGTYYIENLSTNYVEWLDITADYYARAAADLERIGSAEMVGYRQLQKDVFVTEYANGVTVTANYGGEAVTVDGRTIAAQDWLCEGGGAQ